MAGGSVFGSKSNQKNKHFGSNGFTSEVLKDSPEIQSAQPPKKFSLKGILSLGQTIELNQQHSKELFNKINHLEQEQKLLFDSRQKELEKTIENLRQEIKKLAAATQGLQKDVEKVAINPITEVNEYQLSFLERIRVFISNFTKDISQASLWLEHFSAKNKKKNHFWNQVKSKKGGGEQYLFSNEHSVARSGT